MTFFKIGMFQRLDRMRKHSFGSMALFGENNNSTISGVWFWRGHDLAFEVSSIDAHRMYFPESNTVQLQPEHNVIEKTSLQLSEDLQIDYESYEWKKLDPDSDETKKLVKEYFMWEGDFGGKKFNQGKIFK